MIRFTKLQKFSKPNLNLTMVLTWALINSEQ